MTRSYSDKSQEPRAPAHPDRDLWWFYCYRCEQWAQTSGPWCLLYAGEPLTDACYFDDFPGRMYGVPFGADPLTYDAAARPASDPS